MTTTTAFVAVQRLPWGGRPGAGQGLPSGIWFGTVTNTGDGTGGTNAAALTFQTGVQLSARLFMLGALNIRINPSAADRVLSVVSNMGWQGESWNFAALVRTARLNVGQPTEMEATNKQAFRGVLLGGPFNTTEQFVLEATTVNIDLEVLRLSAQGYVWDQETLQVPGGPKLPPDSLYSRG